MKNIIIIVLKEFFLFKSDLIIFILLFLEIVFKSSSIFLFENYPKYQF